MIQNKQPRLSPPPSPPPHSSLLPFFLYAMRRTLPAFLLFAIASVFLFAFFSLRLSRPANLIHHYPVPAADADRHLINYAVRDHDPEIHRTRHVSSVEYSSAISTAAVLLPAWEILIIVSPETPIFSSSSGDYLCLFQNNDTSPARFSKALPFTNRTTLTCPMPNRVKRLRPFLQPVLKTSAGEATAAPPGANSPELIRWNYMVYESFTTEDDVVVFAKGLNNRQGVNRPPTDFRCVFGDVNSRDAVRTAVTSSVQEVFRCGHPNLTDGVNSSSNSKQNQQQEEEGRQTLVRISLEIVDANVVVPTVAYYSPTARPSVGTTQSSQQIFSKNGQSNNKLAAGGDEEEEKHVLCACTMVYNVAKFLREWVIYHSEIGVDRFILYDNDSDDNLESVVWELNREGYNVTTLFWIWPKTQEAGFSHSAIYARHLCKWVAYIDVDEFAFAPYSWAHSDRPSKSMLKSLLPKSHNIKNDNTKNGNSTSNTSSTSSRTSSGVVGQVSIKCNDFGPSNQKSHPVEGVTQGYTCRRRFEQRHKSIVMVEGVADSLLNVIHHFEMKKGYRTRQVSMEEGVVNHYKYQAWAEFQTKFRRRVSAYVVDWTQALNPKSKDRTPGLGFRAVEPKGWADMFCEVRDDRLKMLTKRWFGSSTPNGNRMVWQT